MLGTLKLAVYVLCALTAVSCVALLIRGYRRSGTRLLLWTSICFGFLAIHSAAVLVEILFFPSTDLQTVRHAASLIAGLTLVAGLVWEGE
jgi:cytochrome b subunit of formate dehydrogenase